MALQTGLLFAVYLVLIITPAAIAAWHIRKTQKPAASNATPDLQSAQVTEA